MSWTSCSRRGAAALLAALLLGACSEEPRTLLQVGAPAKPFTLELVDGRVSRLDGYAGHGLVLTFMSSWCPCSNQSLPLMLQAYERHRGDGVGFLMVGIQDSRSNFQQFVGKWRVPFDAGYDKGDRIAKDYGVSVPPSTFFIARDGTVKRAFYGNIAEKPEDFRHWVEEIL